MNEPLAGASTERRLLASTLAAYGSQLGRVAIRAAADLALARLILPAGHGLFDLALGIVVVAGIFRDLGLPYQLVRDERPSYGAACVWIASSSLLLTAALALGAPLFAPLDPGLPAVLRLYSLFVLLDGLAVVPKVFFERRLEVGRLVGPEILRGLAFAAVGIALAAQGWGVWALVWGQLASGALFAALLWWRAWGRMPLAREPGRALALVRRSVLLFAIALLALPVPYVARFVLGAFGGGAYVVGQYGKARDWGFRLQELVLPAVARVLYPALVEYRGDRPRYLGAYRYGTVSILALETLAAYFLFFNAELVLLRILIGENWRPAVPLLRILCFVPLTDPYSRLGGELLKVEGEDRAWLAVVALNLVSLVAFGALLTSALGARGMAWANYLLLGNLLMAWRVRRACGPIFWRLTGDLLLVYLLPLPLFLAAAWAFPDGSWARLGASAAAAAIAGVVLAARFAGPLRRLFRGPAAAAEGA
ncbi:MAG TPA: oligosaccharide flippase family protein [Thermoanaerobaculia bacterium]|nr:oligosaccharide flippase family protein [Thermoanaerobaculia bacterium]